MSSALPKSRAAKRAAALVISLVYQGSTTLRRTLNRMLGRHERPAPTLILTYHSIKEDELAAFDRQMQHLKRRMAPVFADQSVATNGRRPVAVTFDDAFQTVFDSVLPLLAKYQIPVTIFVPTGFLGAEAGWMSAESRRQKRVGPVVSAARLQAVDRRYVRIGSHTVNHPHLASLAPTSIAQELAVSKQTLETLTGDPVGMLALPHGSCSPEVLDAARRAGYEKVFANVPIRRNGSGSVLVGRVDVSPRDWPLEFRLKAQGGYGWLASAIPVKRDVLALLRGKASES